MASAGVRPYNEGMRTVGWLEFNVPFQHKYGYIRDEGLRAEMQHSRPFCATVCKTVRPVLSGRCPVCLSCLSWM